jgi:hypothetical protein
MMCAGVVSSCSEKNTTAPDLGFLQIDPRTVEVFIPFDDFVDDVQAFGGYGSVADLGYGAVALDFGGLNARTLVHLSDFPGDGGGEDVSFVGGRVVLVFDTVRGTLDTPVGVEVFDVSEDWHAATMTWEVTVDTAGDRRFWSQPGGGLTTSLGVGSLDVFRFRQADELAALVDSVSIPIDSSTVAALEDPTGAGRGLLVAATAPGAFLRLLNMKFVLSTVLASSPDVISEVEIPVQDVSSMTDPAPAAPMGWLRVGGTPSWRSVITMSIPRSIAGTAELCGTVGCQIDLTEVGLNLAELVLTTRGTESEFQPQDTTRMELRRVLNTELLPKSPLGPSLVAFIKSVPPELFSTQAGAQVGFSVTNFVAGILSDDAENGTASLALLSAAAPLMIQFASFEGGGGAGAPVLRLLFTVANGVGLP